MGAAKVHDIEVDGWSSQTGSGPDSSGALVLAPDPIQVRRNARLLGSIGMLATGVAIAYLSRALATGSAVDWLLTLVLAGLGVGHLWACLDARTPLLVADPQGIRIRNGRNWRGLAWAALERVEHEAGGRLHDGRLSLVPHNSSVEPLAISLGLATSLSVPRPELSAALQDLAAGSTLVVEPLELVTEDDESHSVWRDPRPVIAETIERVAATRTPAPLREAIRGRRAEVTMSAPADVSAEADPEAEVEDRAGLEHDDDAAESGSHASRWLGSVRPLARAGSSVDPLVIDDFAVEPAEDPIVGPELRAARTRLSLSIDELADRTRIRPHVIEAIEVDDFEPCGGDFYARGHLRTLARVLGIDVTPLLADYEIRYAQAPIDPRRVFEAELASSGSNGLIRGTRGGPNWSVLVAAVMALVLCWSVARLVMDAPVELRSVPALNGSAGPGNGARAAGPTVPVLVRAAGGGASVVVRDGSGKIVFTGDLAYGQTKALEVAAPIRVESSDGSVEIVVDGSEKGPIGDTGQDTSATYVVR